MTRTHARMHTHTHLVHLLEFISDDAKPSHEFIQPLFAEVLKLSSPRVPLIGDSIQLTQTSLVSFILREGRLDEREDKQ